MKAEINVDDRSSRSPKEQPMIGVKYDIIINESQINQFNDDVSYKPQL